MRWLRTRHLLVSGIAGPVLFVAVFLYDGLMLPAYDPERHYVSLASLGQDGWRQAVSFIVTGLLFSTFALGLVRVWSRDSGSAWVPRLIGIVGVALVVDGLFATDPEWGYPPGTPEALPASLSWHGVIHYVAAAIVFLGLAAACLLVGVQASRNRRRLLAIGSVVSPVIMIGAWLVAFTLAAVGGPAEAGVMQRVSIVAGFGWLAMLARTVLATAGRPASVTRLAEPGERTARVGSEAERRTRAP